jgi:hypothetical protein
LYDDLWTLNLASALTEPGNYQLCVINGGVPDICNNVSPGNCLNFTITGISATLNVNSQAGCPGQSNGALSVTGVAGGTPPYYYNWTGPGGFTSTSSSISNRPEGTYYVTVTDALGKCIWTDNATIYNAPPINPQQFEFSNMCRFYT